MESTEIGTRIRQLREQKGLSQENLAAQLGMSQSNFSKLEREDADPSLSRLNEIARALGVDLGELLNLKTVSIHAPDFSGSEQAVVSYSFINTLVNNSLAEVERKFYDEKIRLLEKQIELMQKLID